MIYIAVNIVDESIDGLWSKRNFSGKINFINKGNRMCNVIFIESIIKYY